MVCIGDADRLDERLPRATRFAEFGCLEDFPSQILAVRTLVTAVTALVRRNCMLALR